MITLGISAFYHDSAAALVIDGEIVAAAQEERFSRRKHDPGFPLQAIRYCLDEAGLHLDDLDAVAFYDKPLIKFERLLETYQAFAPKGLPSFITSMPVWIKEKIFLKKLIREGLEEVGDYDRKKLKLLFPEHHLSHAASAYYPSSFSKAAILTIDGVGEWATASISLGEGEKITVLKELHFPHSLGLLYSAFTYFLGFKVNSGEYKLMGLAPYGDADSPDTKRYLEIIRATLCELRPDGSLYLDQSYFGYATGLRMVQAQKWEALFGFPARAAETPIAQQHCNLALAIQQFTEEVVITMAKEARTLTGAPNLCMAGGVALNCVANGKLLEAGIFESIYVQPAAGDAGGALGAALAAEYIYFEQPRKATEGYDAMKGSYLGPAYSATSILATARRFGAVHEQFENEDALAKKTAELLAAGNVIGWFQGRMEFGPRALGGRSILADPRNPEMQKKLNLKIKFREGFRPFAPSVLDSAAGDYFGLKSPSPYMLFVQPVAEKLRKPLPAGYGQLGMMEKLYVERSSLPSITHVDFSARIQTVHEETNGRYWKLIDAFRRQTGCPLLVNTSFNVRGEPIVCTPEDAYRCLMRTDMDYLVIGDFIFDKKKQPEWKETNDWKRSLLSD